MTNNKFKITDWAGNDCISKLEFETFEDAWGVIYEKFADLSDEDAEEQFGDLFVVEVK